MAYTNEEKIRILNFARDNGVVRAAQYFGLSKYSITAWNKQFQVYRQRGRVKYTDAQKLEMLEYARIHGPKKAADKFDVPCPTICTWNAQFKVFPNTQAHYNRTARSAVNYSNEEKVQILKFAQTYGLGVAQKKFNVGRYIMARWNQEYRICTRKDYVKYTEEYKIAALRHAAKFGRKSAIDKYHVTYSLLGKWNAKYNLLTPGQSKTAAATRSKAKFSNEQKIEILNFARVNGVAVAVLKYNITSGRLRSWNRKHQIIPPKNKMLSAEEKKRITACAVMFGIKEAAHRFKLQNSHVKLIVEKQLGQTI